MKPKLVIALLLIVILPIGLLGWLGTRVVRDEQERIHERFEDLLQGRLRDADATVGEVVDTLERRLLELLADVPVDAQSMRALSRRDGAVRQAFVLDQDGKIFYPNPREEITQAERDFLFRTQRIWIDKVLVGAASIESNFRIGRSYQPRSAHGWYVWYWDEGINLIFWRRGESGRVVGVEVEMARLMADILARLPSFDSAKPNPADGCIALADSNGRAMYQWGSYEFSEDMKPRVSIPLRRPLAAWMLHYYVDPVAAGNEYGGSILFALLTALVAVGTALTGLAIYFYRESSREIREATQRVNFVNQVSHELKTPLTNIRMYAELLQQDIPEDDEKLGRHADVVVSESQRLSRLINNVLTFGRSRRKKLELHPVPGVVDDVIGRVVEQFRPSLDEKDMSIACSDEAKETVVFDADVLGQILGNLFGNVEKYAVSGKVLNIKSSQKGGVTTIVVFDRGPGVPREHREKIFEPFHRVSDKLTEGAAGTGIGLAIARDLARLHGGDLVLVPSETGAEFKLTLNTPREES
ncbi:sensor histidine kinase [Planctomycetota bacterium]